jgi:hypothetical protein
VRATAPALRAADPDGEVIAGALYFGLSEVVDALELGIGGPRFLESIALTDALSLVDEVSLHLYRAGVPEGVVSDIELARDVLDEAGHTLPLSSGEWGYSTYDPDAPPDGFNFIPAVTPERQASYLARMLLTNYSLGLRRSVIFKDRDAQDPSPGDIEDHWGLFTSELVKKPSYVAISTLTALLGSAEGAPESLPVGARKHGLRFVLPDSSTVTALWAEQTTTWSIRVVEPSDQTRVLGRDGTDITPDNLVDGAQLEIEPDDGPVYLVGDITVETASGG